MLSDTNNMVKITFFCNGVKQNLPYFKFVFVFFEVGMEGIKARNFENEPELDNLMETSEKRAHFDAYNCTKIFRIYMYNWKWCK
jgi:hypothetical protein